MWEGGWGVGKGWDLLGSIRVLVTRGLGSRRVALPRRRRSRLLTAICRSSAIEGLGRMAERRGIKDRD